jgi:hypothetical protein
MHWNHRCVVSRYTEVHNIDAACHFSDTYLYFSKGCIRTSYCSLRSRSFRSICFWLDTWLDFLHWSSTGKEITFVTAFYIIRLPLCLSLVRLLYTLTNPISKRLTAFVYAPIGMSEIACSYLSKQALLTLDFCISCEHGRRGSQS